MNSREEYIKQKQLDEEKLISGLMLKLQSRLKNYERCLLTNEIKAAIQNEIDAFSNTLTSYRLPYEVKISYDDVTKSYSVKAECKNPWSY